MRGATRTRRMRRRTAHASSEASAAHLLAMCRIAGFLGSPVTLSSVVSEPTHSLRAQGRAPRELPPGMLGSDGYGIGWMSEHAGEPARYRQTLPIWSDVNLDTLAPHIRASCFVAATRTAQDGMPVAITNTPPFCFGSVLLVHNGSIERFHQTVSEELRQRLGPELRTRVQGNTDSEYLAALVAQASGADLEQRVRGALKEVCAAVRRAKTVAQLNLIAVDGQQLIAVRYALGKEAPSLYFAERAESGVVVASEAMSEHETWTRVPEDHLVRVSRHGKHGVALALREI
jgi:gamma-glutamyl hercynylcysteine S-oxide hydrolase